MSFPRGRLSPDPLAGYQLARYADSRHVPPKAYQADHAARTSHDGPHRNVREAGKLNMPHELLGSRVTWSDPLTATRRPGALVACISQQSWTPHVARATCRSIFLRAFFSGTSDGTSVGRLDVAL